jgi:hypothetical protein
MWKSTMTIARAETVDPTKQSTYHCWSRCVRRAFLCGFDALTGKNFDHRKKWIERRMEELVGIFAISVLAYALMDNHEHVMLRNFPKKALAWSDQEVARRWFRLFPRRCNKAGEADEPNESELAEITKDPKRIEELRLRLCNISWFMRCLNENIARQANKEDEVSGRFWEGRFKCARLDDDAATLSCMVYIDLNPIRAGRARTPEESEFTSAYTRLCAEEKNLKSGRTASVPRRKNKTSYTSTHNWLCPIESVLSGNSMLSLEEYLMVLDDTGRELAKGKRGRIPQHLRPILERVSINPDNWLMTSRRFGGLFPRVAGKVQKMRAAATLAGRNWFKGLSAAAVCF